MNDSTKIISNPYPILDIVIAVSGLAIAMAIGLCGGSVSSMACALHRYAMMKFLFLTRVYPKEYNMLFRHQMETAPHSTAVMWLIYNVSIYSIDTTIAARHNWPSIAPTFSSVDTGTSMSYPVMGGVL